MILTKLQINILFLVIGSCVLSIGFILCFYCLFQPGLLFRNGKIEEICYNSSFDDTLGLYAVVSYPIKGDSLPIVILMHEYGKGKNRYSLLSSIKRWTSYGFFVISPDMRGRGWNIPENILIENMMGLRFPEIIRDLICIVNRRLGMEKWLSTKYQISGGKRDSGLNEINDIYDAVQEVVRKYKNVNKDNVNIVGYSGGGGNVLSAVTRFPWIFKNGVSFFGISDYGYWYKYCDDGKIRQQLEEDIGGTPWAFPEEYRLRNSLLRVQKSRDVNIFLFFDEEEKRCPKEMNFLFKKAADSLGFNNVKIFESNKGDSVRWRHGNPSTKKDLIRAEEIFLPYFLDKDSCTKMD